MRRRFSPASLADHIARFMDTGRLPPDIINELCDEVQALQDQCASLIRERETLRAKVTRLECGPWVQCGYCNHTVYVNASKMCPKCGTEVTYG